MMRVPCLARAGVSRLPPFVARVPPSTCELCYTARPEGTRRTTHSFAFRYIRGCVDTKTEREASITRQIFNE